MATISKADQVLTVASTLLELFNRFRPILDGFLNNEAERRGMTRAELNQFTKRLNAETIGIATEDASDTE